MTPARLLLVLVALALVTGLIIQKPKNPQASLEEVDRLRSANLALTTRLDFLEEQLADLKARLAREGELVPEILVEFVERDLAFTFLTPPVFFRVPEAELYSTVRRNLLTISTDLEAAKEDKVWRILGLIGEDESLSGGLLAVALNSPPEVYDLAENQILIPTSFSLESIPDQAELVRLLAQKAATQLAGLPPADSSPDRWRAWEAITLGTALDCQKRYLRRRSAQTEPGRQSPETERDAILLNLSPAIQNLANFPNLSGQELANQKYLKSRSAFVDFLKNPPTTTFQILFPDAPPPPPAQIDLVPDLYQTSLGALGLRTLLDPILGLEKSTELTSAWRSDLATLQETPKGDLLTWSLTLSSPEEAADLAKTLQDTPSLNPADRLVTFTTEGPTLTFSSAPK